ncbi:hypothetical protein Pint_06923 [Pistacia integerrima]|uniref:Uncharacterized protein n=1 Tax=Pistacia integerrima TaxID=434235 RepID=A0ACC0XSP2_9ROSI|nr:hypothetical protein Pint_06923 [Pistacia integerrima]
MFAIQLRSLFRCWIKECKIFNIASLELLEIIHRRSLLKSFPEKACWTR